MSDWEFLYEMHDRGFSAAEIADAAASGLAPWEMEYLDAEWIDSELENEPKDNSFAIPNINEVIHDETDFPLSTLEQANILHDLIDCAIRHFENTGRYLQVWGELGEIYAEIKFGLRRHKTHTAGSDGTIAGKLVEVKTISPEKGNDLVLVKSQGDWQQLLIVRIDKDFQFQSKLLNRSELSGGMGEFFKVRFGDSTNI